MYYFIQLRGHRYNASSMVNETLTPTSKPIHLTLVQEESHFSVAKLTKKVLLTPLAVLADGVLILVVSGAALIELPSALFD